MKTVSEQTVAMVTDLRSYWRITVEYELEMQSFYDLVHEISAELRKLDPDWQDIEYVCQRVGIPSDRLKAEVDKWVQEEFGDAFDAGDDWHQEHYWYTVTRLLGQL